MISTGGNHLLAGKLLITSGAEIVKQKVEKVTKGKSGYKIQTEDKTDHDFDIVILAAPVTSDTQILHFEGVKDVNLGGHYHRYFFDRA